MSEETDSIYIELVVTAEQSVHSETEIYMQGSLEIRINNQLPCSSGDIVDVDALLESLEKEGEYYIFSCNCGIPACSGWYKGIDVKHEGELITWHDPNTNRSWRLERGRMEEDIEAAKEELVVYKRFFEQKQIDYVGVGYNW